MIHFFALLTIIAFTSLGVQGVKVFSNPVIQKENLPDPGAIFYDGFYYVANTAGGSDPGKFPIHKSKDLQNWDYVGDIFDKDDLPSWAIKDNAFWAPEIHVINGKFRVVFTAREKDSQLLCIGIGSADDIKGPYKDSGAPVIKNKTVGSIDASVLAAPNNTYYLIWKDDGNGNSPEIPTWIKAQLLNSDGLSVTGEVHYLIKNDLAWEANVVEGPWIIQANQYYYLFYSGHDYCDDTYAVGVARSTSPLGPYEKKGDPILKSNAKWIGPGHCSVLSEENKGETFVMIYHSWYKGQVCTGYHRLLMVDYVHWKDGWPFMTNNSPTFADPNGYAFSKWFE